MNLAELQAAVYTETNRPDMVAETLQAVLASTLRMHCLDFFYKDIATAQIVFDESQYIQVMDVTDLPRYRSICYMRKNDPSLAAFQQNPSILPPLTSSIAGLSLSVLLSMGFLQVLTPDNILDNYGAEKVDVCYQAGATLFFRSSTALKYVLAGWYAYPDLQAVTFNSWIARELPYCIVYDAASALFQKMGQNEASRKYDSPTADGGGLVQQQIRILLINNIVAQGR